MLRVWLLHLLQRRNMKLVSDWKQAWKWISVNCMVIATAVQGAWMYIPDDMKAEVPHNIVHILTMLLLVLGLAGRLIKQGGTDAAPPAV